jgi:hypothetical protein
MPPGKLRVLFLAEFTGAAGSNFKSFLGVWLNMVHECWLRKLGINSESAGMANLESGTLHNFWLRHSFTIAITFPQGMITANFSTVCGKLEQTLAAHD